MSVPIRKCHVCGEENSEFAFFCSGCGADISRVVARVRTPLPVEAPAPEIEAASKPAGETLRKPPASGEKKCPQCGAGNEAFLILCRQCGADIQAAVTRPATCDESAPERALRLILEIGLESFECRDGDVLGREGTIACQTLAAIKTVSRRHVSVSLIDGRWHVTALAGVRNVTRLDGGEMTRNAAQPLTGEHTLQMSTQCAARLRVVSGS